MRWDDKTIIECDGLTRKFALPREAGPDDRVVVAFERGFPRYDTEGAFVVLADVPPAGTRLYIGVINVSAVMKAAGRA